jgi:hypothetical protein
MDWLLMVIKPVPGDLTVTSPRALFLEHPEKYKITIHVFHPSELYILLSLI